PSRYTYPNLMEKREFTISIPSADYVCEADFFGIASGETTDKFAATGLTPVKASAVDAPYVGEFPVILECRVSAVTEIGAHTQFIGTILDLKTDESVLDAEGKPDRSKLRPFAYDPLQVEYFTMAASAGKAFSCGKKFTV
ncbi:flavin reductase family protein, partial [Methanoregula sp.]|uniref:flavin reductase family protein n=1 Tax=Methanoregula sp. TaxID=2052170 RepID=UPI000CB1396F